MKHILPIILILLLALAFVSCHHGERQTLRSALQMAYADPDSALTMLHTIDRRALPPAEKAYYALTYYLAQNKSGLDVANDSSASPTTTMRNSRVIFTQGVCTTWGCIIP